MTTRLFKNAGILSSERSDPKIRDVLVEDGTIKEIDSSISYDDVESIDCGESYLIPGLYDMHVHLREPGREDTETIKSGSEAAINGGITGMLAMPNTDPAVDTGSMVEFIHKIARADSRIPIHTSGCITKQREGHELAEIGDMYHKGAPLITDDGDPVENSQVLRRAFEYSKNFDMIVAEHCEIPELSAGGALHEGRVSYDLGLPGIPSTSEEICIDRDLRLASMTDASVHIQHLSTVEGLESIKRFKNDGLDVTAEVTPHHLIFSQEDLSTHNTSLKMNPPIRTEADRHALVDGLNSGAIDMIVTDHAPHADFEKRQDFNSAPFGIIGLDVALLSLYDRLIAEGELEWSSLIQAFSTAPRERLGFETVEITEENKANFLLFDPNSTTHISRDYLQSKSHNTPFLDEELRGRISLVVTGDEILLDRRNKSNKSLSKSETKSTKS